MRTLAAPFVCAAVLFAIPAVAQDADRQVDVELVLAVDVSWSMNDHEQRIQREGYVAAFRSPEVQRAMLDGALGRVAVTFVEWAGASSQTIVIPWTLIDTAEGAEAFAQRLEEEEPSRRRRTSISSAIAFSADLIRVSPYEGLRRVIDISGDGPNNEGVAVTLARDAAVAAGITINGLPLMTTGGDAYEWSWGSIPDLDRYYADCVIGGPSSFMIPVNDWAQFPEAVRRKLVMELAGGWEGILPELESNDRRVVPAQAPAAASDCLIGERLWRERQERYEFN